MRIAVTDASIFIDLMVAALLDDFAALDLEILTTFEVLSELYPDQQELLLSLTEAGRLTVHTLSEDALSVWRAKHDISTGLSYPDQTVLCLAMEQNAMVLTGDNLMRKTAIKLDIAVGGILWIFDQLLEASQISHRQAMIGLESVMEVNKRLPQTECERRLARWSDQI